MSWFQLLKYEDLTVSVLLSQARMMGPHLSVQGLQTVGASFIFFKLFV